MLNERALELIIKAGLALNCQIERVAKLHRKNYFIRTCLRAIRLPSSICPCATTVV